MFKIRGILKLFLCNIYNLNIIILSFLCSLPISPGEPEPEAKPASSASSQPIVIPHDEVRDKILFTLAISSPSSSYEGDKLYSGDLFMNNSFLKSFL
jgi:hypothetical protein